MKCLWWGKKRPYGGVWKEENEDALAVSLLLSLRTEVLASLAKENTSIFHLRGTNVNLSHTSCFPLSCIFHLDLPHFCLAFLPVLRVSRLCCNRHFWLVSITALLYLMITLCLNFSSCRMSKPSVTLDVCKVLNLRVCACARYACYLYLCVRHREMRSKKPCTHTHTHTLTQTHTYRSLSLTLSAPLFIHLPRLSDRLYHPVSYREITSDKLGWLNRLGKLGDPANNPPSVTLSP